MTLVPSACGKANTLMADSEVQQFPHGWPCREDCAECMSVIEARVKIL